MSNTTEYEIKVIGADIDELRIRLKELKFSEIPRFMFKRRVYEFEDGGWIRLRTDGKKTTLTYKKSLADKIDGMEEIETEVADFDNTHKILVKAGIKPKNYQENYRTIYTTNDIEITIDEWPLIDPYVEIEGESVDAVKKYLKNLKLDQYQTTSKPTSYVYELAGLNLNDYDDLRFDQKSKSG